MNNSKFFIINLIIIITIVVISYVFFYKSNQKKENIYCVMITGKDINRLQFAKKSIQNFKDQDYPNKKLIIINENQQRIFNKEYSTNNDMIEIQISDRKKKHLTLGDLRNIAFNFIPINSIWTLWDDDDIRSSNYLTYLYQRLRNYDYILFTKRIEHNTNTNFSWIMELKSGFVIFFGRKKYDTLYNSTEYNEDIPLKKLIIDKYKHLIIDNDPRIYVRIVHENNTSIIIKKNKKHIKDTTQNKVYFEHKISQDDKKYVNNIISKFKRI